MTIELKVPESGESIQEVQIGRWLKSEGDSVAEDEELVELETDKASMELPSPAEGVLREILKREGDTVSVGDVIALLEENGRKTKKKKKDRKKRKKETAAEAKPKRDGRAEEEPPAEAPEAEGEEREARREDDLHAEREERQERKEQVAVTPAARRELRRYGLSAEEIEAPPEQKRIRPEDVRRFVKQRDDEREAGAEKRAKEGRFAAEKRGDDRELEETVPMSPIRRRIAQRLVEAQQQAALLTTFNEIDMSQVIQLRKQYGEAFRERWGVKLGFMSFFVKAAVDALKQQPEVNAEIRDGDQIVYRNYYHIGIAVGGGKGLVVPVLRHAQRMSFAEIEQAIGDFAQRAEQNHLEPGELQGGTFTISNGGVYGSLLSTPIVNPPQSGVLGMHVIEDRPVARDGQVVIRPMMYVALTYDHRLVDGREAVRFLNRIKQAVEQPSRMLIEV